MRANDEVAALLEEYADLIAITGGDAFKVRVYEKAARSVAGHPDDIAALDGAGLRAIPNVGKSIALKIEEYLRTGAIHQVDEMRTRIPSGVRRLTRIPTLGPRRAMLLYEELGIASVEQLAAAIEDGALHGLHGFGPKTEENLLHGIELVRTAGQRSTLGDAMELAETIVGELSAVAGCERCGYAGSLRRMRDTVGDIDVLATSARPAALMAAFTGLPVVDEVIASGPTKTSVRTGKGIQVDLRVVPPEDWGAALQYFTGSKAHNIRTREIAVRAGLKLSEYGLFDVASGDKVVSRTEEEVYARLGLPWIPPQLREDTGEIEAALRGELPDLVAEADIRGDLHTHTDLSDGLASLEEMAAAAAGRGYSYYAVTDHAPNLYMHRTSDEKMLEQRARLRELDGSFGGLRLLHGTELNIDPEGGVDWPPEFLAGFDLCVASVHSHFTQPRDAMTRRLVRACENPHVHVLGHPTARLIGRRPPIDADLDEVFRACARTGTAVEIDASPERLDLAAEHVRLARRHGVAFTVDSDAHATPHLAFLRYGVGTAQRGWLTAGEVLNTWPLERVRRFLRREG
ncbi:DNA polymerase/3'-5' exonuclease PolX [Marinitenerispora sediminis]|uniref:DNA-directed DNA polymerase n=1 Tax=Marinitenerispora sediminis TaxID=1931232 RepID=A0A368T7T5_9ACTN|nr:DNA polymerase/3'-5' exonuclease PolX [Marinitenerispora sediminis]RCV51200.1 DNA polymerase/3'-5' exonuclease PolX [Marinitenerispora sediminis]RCV56450.1 DNA polymerase/3'-5' exonuclease PolX [Marinitenerispora sediminis]RCV60157.1 DNA polymerase/3'-5' exonuclease PolX [Marinitenerispora sediminis]